MFGETNFRKLGTWTERRQNLAIFNLPGGGALPRRRRRAIRTHAPVATLVTWGAEDGGGPGGRGNAKPRGPRGVRGSQCKLCGLELGRRNKSGTGMSWGPSGDGLGLAAPSRTDCSLL